MPRERTLANILVARTALPLNQWDAQHPLKKGLEGMSKKCLMTDSSTTLEDRQRM